MANLLVADWFRNRIKCRLDNTRTTRTFLRQYQNDRLFGSYIPDDGPFENEQERTDWRMANWGTIHEATNVTFNDIEGMRPDGEDEFVLEITFTSYRTIPYKFFEHIESMGFNIETCGYSIVGDNGDAEDTILYDNGTTAIVRHLREGLWEFGWDETDSWITELLTFMEDNDDQQLSEDIQDMFPHPEYDPNAQVESDTDDHDTEDDDDTENEECKKKTIRKSPRNAFLGELVEAPDTEYTCLICHTEKSDEVPDPTKILMTACGHLFHRFCIKEWVKNASTQPSGHNRCPACRTEIVAFHGPESTLNSQETDAVQTPKE